MTKLSLGASLNGLGKRQLGAAHRGVRKIADRVIDLAATRLGHRRVSTTNRHLPQDRTIDRQRPYRKVG